MKFRNTFSALAVLGIILFFCLIARGAGDSITLSSKERAYLSKKKEIIFVSQTRYPPFEFVDQNGEHTGMCIELARWMGTELGFLSKGLDMARKNGTIDRITRKWIGREYSERGSSLLQVLPYLYVISGGIILLLFMVWFWNFRLRGEVRKRTEDLHESEIKFRTIFDSVNDAIFVHDVNTGAILDVNQRTCEMYGYTREEVLALGSNVPKSGTHPYSQEEAMAWMEKAARGEPQLFEWLTKDKGGREFWVEVNMKRASIGDRERLLVVARNIDERKRSEEALRKAKNRYQSIFDNAVEGISLWTSEGQYISANPVLAQILGYDSPDDLATSLKDIGAELYVDPGKLDELLREIRKNGLVRDFRAELYRKEGSIAVVSMNSRGVFDKEGSLIHIEVFLQDITDRVQSETALALSEQRCRSLVENTLDGYFICDASTGQFMFVNQRICDIFGRDMTEVPKLKVFNVVSEKDHARIKKRVRERMTGKAPAPAQDVYTGIRKDGSTFRVEVSASLVTFQGRTAVQGILRDITEKENLERELRQAQKMEAVGTLAGGVAHDFNNLLQGILGYTQMLLMSKGESDPETSNLEQIERAAKRASELTRQLLAFSRKVKSRLRPVNLNQEVGQIRKLLQRTIPKMINIKLCLEGHLHVIDADPAQLQQVMMNLAINARDAMPDGGKLVIETENVSLDNEYCETHPGAKPGRYALLSISDTGTGMDRKTADHVFEPFFTTKGVGKGTGLGLSMVYGIMKSHGGYITCCSEPGEGTTFKIYFPAKEGVPTGFELKPQGDEAEPEGGSETILLVDDEEMLRDIGEHILQKFGYTVLLARDGESALALYQEKPEHIALVILDLIMPGMGGKRCLEEILKISPGAKVVIASGYSANAHARDVLDIGARAFVTKPYEINQLLDVVRKVLDRR
jgi:two-component system cell cycle sensor histidine kinase/response regulator CckA